MTGAVKVAALFLGYGAVGLGGDYVAALVGGETADDRVVVEVMSVADVMEDVQVAVDVQVRSTDECAYSVERQVAVPADVGQLLRLRHGSGELSVHGREGLDEVRATGTVCASHEDFLDELTLTAEQVDGEIILSAHYPESRGWRGNTKARIDVVVEMPLNLDVDVDDSSGGLVIAGAGALHIDDSSGSIRVEEASGDVLINDGSGGIDVVDVAGGLTIRDGSGSISVSRIGGSVEIVDGSGSVDVSSVQAGVTVTDGSGSINVRDVAGALSVPADGSGSIRHSDIRGSVDIPRRHRNH